MRCGGLEARGVALRAIEQPPEGQPYDSRNRAVSISDRITHYLTSPECASTTAGLPALWGTVDDFRGGSVCYATGPPKGPDPVRRLSPSGLGAAGNS